MEQKRLIANIKAEIARELGDPRSPWTHSELMARLAIVEQLERTNSNA